MRQRSLAKTPIAVTLMTVVASLFIYICLTQPSAAANADSWSTLLAYKAVSYGLFDGNYGYGTTPMGHNARIYITFKNLVMNKKITSFSYDVRFQDATGLVLYTDSFTGNQSIASGAETDTVKYIYYEDSIIKKDDIYDKLAPSITAKDLRVFVTVRSIVLDDAEAYEYPGEDWQLPPHDTAEPFGQQAALKISSSDPSVLWQIIGRVKTPVFESASDYLRIEWYPNDLRQGTALRAALCSEDGREIAVVSDSFAVPSDERQAIVRCKPGRYYLDVECKGTPWTIKISESQAPALPPEPVENPGASQPAPSTAAVSKQPAFDLLAESLERWAIRKDSFCLAMDTGLLLGAIRSNGFGYPEHILGASTQPAVDYRMIINNPDKGLVKDTMVSILQTEPDISRDKLIEKTVDRLTPKVFRYLQGGIEFYADNTFLPRAGIGILIPASKKVSNRGFYDLGIRYPLYANLGFIAEF